MSRWQYDKGVSCKSVWCQGRRTEWTGVGMYTPLLPESISGIDADWVSFLRGGGEGVRGVGQVWSSTRFPILISKWPSYVCLYHLTKSNQIWHGNPMWGKTEFLGSQPHPIPKGVGPSTQISLGPSVYIYILWLTVTKFCSINRREEGSTTSPTRGGSPGNQNFWGPHTYAHTVRLRVTTFNMVTHQEACFRVIHWCPTMWGTSAPDLRDPYIRPHCMTEQPNVHGDQTRWEESF